MTTRQQAIENCRHWWLCENIVHHKGQVGLLRMDFPRVFILIEAWNFLALFEEEEENQYEANNGYQDDF